MQGFGFSAVDFTCASPTISKGTRGRQGSPTSRTEIALTISFALEIYPCGLDLGMKTSRVVSFFLFFRNSAFLKLFLAFFYGKSRIFFAETIYTNHLLIYDFRLRSYIIFLHRSLSKTFFTIASISGLDILTGVIHRRSYSGAYCIYNPSLRRLTLGIGKHYFNFQVTSGGYQLHFPLIDVKMQSSAAGQRNISHTYA